MLRVWPTLALVVALAGASGCSEGNRVPGATPACDTREAPLLGCGAAGGGTALASIRDACSKLASCGLVSIEGGRRSFEDCVGDFEGYPIDNLPAILACIGRTECAALPDPNDRNVSICERLGR